MTEKILIIGACGFVGSNFIRQAIYNKYPYQLVGLDSIFYKNSIQNIYQHNKYKFYLNDFSDTHALKLILELEKPNKILFLAQPTSQIQTFDFYCHKLKNFFEIVSDSDIGKKCQLLFLTNDDFWAPEIYREYIQQNSNFSLCFTPYLFGARQNYQSLLPQCLVAKKMKQVISLNKNFNYNWMWIDDLCSGINLLFQNWQDNQNCYLESSWSLSQFEMGKEIGIVLNDMSWLSSSDSESASSLEWVKKTLQAVSWPATEKFHSALKKTIEWYEKNQWFTKSFGEVV